MNNIYKKQDKRRNKKQAFLVRSRLLLIPIASLVVGLAACSPTTTANTVADTAAETAASPEPAATETSTATTKT